MRIAIGVLAVLLGCGRGHRDEVATTTPVTGAEAGLVAAADAGAAAACTLAPVPLRYPAAARVVAIGDLHGDLAAMRAALRAAGAIDDKDHWSGGTLVIVQTGDILDRGDDEQAMLDLFAQLATEAQAAGGAVIQLLGNHELMNGAGDFRYVTPGGAHDFDDAPGARASAPLAMPAELRGRAQALLAGGAYAHRLAQHAVIAIVGDTIYSHAGVLGPWAARIDEVNQASRCWLDGQSATQSPALLSDDSPVWTRAVGGASPDCAAVAKALATLGLRRMVVGHTPQPHGISSACDDALWRIDVGLSRHYGGPIEVLELSASAAPKILHGTR